LKNAWLLGRGSGFFVSDILTSAIPASGLVYLSIQECANRWRCSRGSVYNYLRAFGAKVVDFAQRGKKGKKVVPLRVVLEIEAARTKRL